MLSEKHMSNLTLFCQILLFHLLRERKESLLISWLATEIKKMQYLSVFFCVLEIEVNIQRQKWWSTTNSSNMFVFKDKRLRARKEFRFDEGCDDWNNSNWMTGFTGYSCLDALLQWLWYCMLSSPIVIKIVNLYYLYPHYISCLSTGCFSL